MVYIGKDLMRLLSSCADLWLLFKLHFIDWQDIITSFSALKFEFFIILTPRMLWTSLFKINFIPTRNFAALEYSACRGIFSCNSFWIGTLAVVREEHEIIFLKSPIAGFWHLSSICKRLPQESRSATPWSTSERPNSWFKIQPHRRTSQSPSAPAYLLRFSSKILN